MSSNQLITGSRAGCHLRVDFVWKTDRYVQTLVIVRNSDRDQGEIAVLTSLEGDSQQTWPPSPPLQDLNFHELPSGRQAALAVGMAGKSHWSIAWEASLDQPLLVCDVACRVKETPSYLASTWELAANVSATRAGDLRIEAKNVILRLATEPDDEFAATLEHMDGQIRLFPNRIETDAPATVRWRYLVTVVGP